MNREQAINYLKSSGMSQEQIKTVVEALQPEPCEDAISRQEAIYALADVCIDYDVNGQHDKGTGAGRAKEVIEHLPSVQPKVIACGDGELSERTEKRTETHACDLIDRAAAQTEIQMNVKRMTLAFEAHGEGRVVYSEDVIKVSDAVDVLRNLPSAQPEQKSEYTESDYAYCTECEHVEMCRWYPMYGCEFKSRPSEQPERKTGKWIPFPGNNYQCSVCGNTMITNPEYAKKHLFCWRCGAKMEVE